MTFNADFSIQMDYKRDDRLALILKVLRDGDVRAAVAARGLTLPGMYFGALEGIQARFPGMAERTPIPQPDGTVRAAEPNGTPIEYFADILQTWLALDSRAPTDAISFAYYAWPRLSSLAGGFCAVNRAGTYLLPFAEALGFAKAALVAKTTSPLPEPIAQESRSAPALIPVPAPVAARQSVFKLSGQLLRIQSFISQYHFADALDAELILKGKPHDHGGSGRVEEIPAINLNGVYYQLASTEPLRVIPQHKAPNYELAIVADKLTPRERQLVGMNLPS